MRGTVLPKEDRFGPLLRETGAVGDESPTGTFGRLLAVLSALQSGGVCTGPDLAGRLGVTVRTIRRDIERLRELGYPIDADLGVAGGYRLGFTGWARRCRR